MRQVLITRPEPGLRETAARVTAMGLEPVPAPMLIIEHRPPFDPPQDFAATILTSRNAVPACPPVCHAKPAFAVGSATAAHAREAGFRIVHNADADAAALPNLITATIGESAQTLIFPIGEGQGTDLAHALRERGFRVWRRVAYKAAPATALPEGLSDQLQQGGIGTALFFSSATARAFVRLVQAAGLEQSVAAVEAVSISARTAMALTPLTWRRISVASRPNQDSMLVLLK